MDCKVSSLRTLCRQDYGCVIFFLLRERQHLSNFFSTCKKEAKRNRLSTSTIKLFFFCFFQHCFENLGFQPNQQKFLIWVPSWHRTEQHAQFTIQELTWAETNKWDNPTADLRLALSGCAKCSDEPEYCIFPHHHSSCTTTPGLSWPTVLWRLLRSGCRCTQTCLVSSKYDCCTSPKQKVPPL